MTTIAGTAAAFAAGKSAKCHNATTDGVRYLLHGHPIAEWVSPGCRDQLKLDWCGYYTVTTANHMNKILTACGIDTRVSRKLARTGEDPRQPLFCL
jgi:hypothetical protein